MDSNVILFSDIILEKNRKYVEFLFRTEILSLPLEKFLIIRFFYEEATPSLQIFITPKILLHRLPAFSSSKINFLSLIFLNQTPWNKFCQQKNIASEIFFKNILNFWLLIKINAKNLTAHVNYEYFLWLYYFFFQILQIESQISARLK